VAFVLDHLPATDTRKVTVPLVVGYVDWQCARGSGARPGCGS
jgi:hypothetical protein